MENFAIHMRITGLGVSDNEVDTRKAAAEELQASWSKPRPHAAVLTTATQLAEALSGEGMPPAALGEEVQALVQKNASSFLHSERPLEVGVVAGMAAAGVLNTAVPNGWTVSEILANALWSALAYQAPLEEPKREALRLQVLSASEARCRKVAEVSRQRTDVPNFGELTVTPTEEANKFTTTFAKATVATIAALQRNAALDREELDFLWWAQIGRSRILNRPLMSIVEPVRLVAAGIEGAGYLRRLPCDVHRDLVLRTLQDDPELDLKELHAAIGSDRHVLGNGFASGNVTSFPYIFPLLNSLATGDSDTAGNAIKRRASEWGARALLEAGFNHILVHGIGKL
jgi:hypothetical protein